MKGQELQPTKPPRARTTLGGFLDLSRGPDDGFEEGSSSSSAGTSSSSSSSSSSSEGSSSDSDTGSEPSDSDSDNRSCPLRPIPTVSPAAAAAASAAGEAIYVASSGSEAEAEAEADDRQDRRPQNRTRETTTRSPSGADAAAVRHLDAAAALTETKTETETNASASSGGGVGRQGDDGGSAGCRGGIADSSEKVSKEQHAESETGPTAAEEALGFYVDCRPDPELLKLVAKEREEANNGNSGASGGERLTQGNPGQELSGGSNSGGGAAGGVGKGDRPPTERKPISSGLRVEPVEEGAPRAQQEGAPPASELACFEGETAPRVACYSSSSVLPKGWGEGKGKGKKLPRSSSPSSMRSLQSASSAGGSKERGDGRLRAVFKPDGGGWMFVNGKEKSGDNNTADPQDGGEEEEEEEEEDKDTWAEKSASPTSSLHQKAGSSDATGSASTLYDITAAASCPGETAAQLAKRLRAESERTARLTADAATLAAKLSSPGGDGAPTESSASAPQPDHGWRLAVRTDGGDVEWGGRGGGGGGGRGDGARRSGSKDPDQVERGKGTRGKRGETKGGRNDGDGTGEHGNSEGEEEEDREVQHADGLMALVRVQERRNRGGTLPPAFLPPTASNRQGEGRAGESSRAAKLQVGR